ncbi:unnamed protein product [Prorocentrum cordatum]|uniref:Uncharacterized protein n=1 Tax=Prorocentrum cordatum TaxID=2364126 RepID=A0ABN9W727_9DINO|nr:unnamed protein product [Polarella glacialis]
MERATTECRRLPPPAATEPTVGVTCDDASRALLLPEGLLPVVGLVVAGGPVQIVQQADVAEVAVEQLVMQIMHVGLVVQDGHPRPLVAAVVRLCAHDCVRDPAIREEDVELVDAAYAEEGPEVGQ